mgnify:CR=1 FL=1
MGLLKSITSILKNVGTAAGITAATAGKKAIERARTEYNVRTKGTGSPRVDVARDTATKVKHTTPPKPKVKNSTLQIPPTDTSKMMKSTTHKQSRVRRISTAGKTTSKVKTPTSTANAQQEDELAKLRAENAQLKEWITKYKERTNAIPEGDKYESRGFDLTSKMNLNKAGLTVDSTSGGIVDANGKLIAQYAGYTPDEIARFFREHPELADSEDSPELRRSMEQFFAGIPIEGSDFEQADGSFF